MNFKTPLFKLNFDKQEEEAVLEVIQSKWISMGPKTVEFETKFAQKLDVNYAIATSNCTVALHLAFKLVDLKEGDEVICPSLTFVATVNAIRYMNATPVFADVTSFEQPNIDPDSILKRITPKTKAIIVMHYAGFSCDMDAITKIAKEHNLALIEDACHAPLSEYKGRKLGTIGDIGCFSFFSNKNISTGEGGMLVTNSEKYAEKAKLLRSHGMTTMSYERSKGHSTTYDVIEAGYNYRLDDIHAAIGVVQLSKLEDDIKKRNEIRKLYISCLEKNSDILIPFKNHSYFSSCYIFPIVLLNSTSAKRNKIRDILAMKGIQTSIHYPSVHKFSIYEKYYTKLPITEYLSDNLITLPMYGSLTFDDISEITDTLNLALAIN